MIIGNFKQDENGAYHGSIHSLSFQMKSVSIVAKPKSNDSQPDFRVLVETGNGNVELGAAWKKRADDGRDYISVNLDGPLMAAPVNAWLNANTDGDGFTLTWSRPKSKTSGAKSDKAKPKTVNPA